MFLYFLKKNCHNQVDSYFNMENGVIFIDLILCKNQAFRHLIFNRFPNHKEVYFG